MKTSIIYFFCLISFFTIKAQDHPVNVVVKKISLLSTPTVKVNWSELVRVTDQNDDYYMLKDEFTKYVNHCSDETKIFTVHKLKSNDPTYTLLVPFNITYCSFDFAPVDAEYPLGEGMKGCIYYLPHEYDSATSRFNVKVKTDEIFGERRFVEFPYMRHSTHGLEYVTGIIFLDAEGTILETLNNELNKTPANNPGFVSIGLEKEAVLKVYGRYVYNKLE